MAVEPRREDLPGRCSALPNAPWVEHVPQLDVVTRSRMRIEQGSGYPYTSPGLGIDRDRKAIGKRRVGPAARIA